jgi:hypothetical protein
MLTKNKKGAIHVKTKKLISGLRFAGAKPNKGT